MKYEEKISNLQQNGSGKDDIMTDEIKVLLNKIDNLNEISDK